MRDLLVKIMPVKTPSQNLAELFADVNKKSSAALSNKNWIKTQSAADLPGVRALTRNFVSEYAMPRHVHQEYVFSLAIKGATEFDCGHCGATHILQPNHLLLTEAHEVYASWTLGKPPWQFRSLSISKEKFGLLTKSVSDGKIITAPHFTHATIRNDEIRRLFLALHESLNADFSTLEQETRLLDWVAALQQNYTEESSKFQNRRVYSETDAVRRVREFIRENVGEILDFQKLADIARLSPFHLNRSFKAQIGLPPHEFQNQLRVKKSLDLIAQKKSFAEIAYAVGFSDQSHFIRFFKRFTGVTPKNFLAR